MEMQRFLLGLTVINLVLLVFLLVGRPEPALATSGLGVLRGNALEIVDQQGRVRASIKVQPAETFQPTGTRYPETVVLRLIDPKGRPEVKIAASEEGGGLSFVGASDETRILLHAKGPTSSLRLTNQSGGEELIRP